VSRPIGKAQGLFTIPSEFFAPLDGEDIDAFEGAAASPSPRVTASRTAERGPSGTRVRRPSRKSKRA